MKISVCIPMYNEGKVIENTARALDAYMRKEFADGDYEIIFSDDGSQDESRAIVEALGLSGVKVIGGEQNRGKGCAVRRAFLEAKGDVVMFTDADLAYGTEIVGKVFGEMSARPDADVLIGSRNLTKDGYDGYTFIRKIASKAYIKVLCFTGGFKLSDSQCGCKAFRYDAVRKIFPRCEVDGFAFDFEAILWATKLGMNVIEMPVKLINHGDTKVKIVRDTFRMLKDLREMKKRISKAEN